jgi:CxxC motif-containing protein (DUF1111 family)
MRFLILPLLFSIFQSAGAAAEAFSEKNSKVLEKQGGSLTVFSSLANAFALPAPKASHEHRKGFVVGNSLFNENWVASPASVKTRQGLGPVFNSLSCSTCHFKDGRGAPPEKESDPFVGILLRLSIPGKSPQGGPVPVPNYGDQIQHRAISGVSPEATVVIQRTSLAGKYPDGTPYTLEKPSYRIQNLAYGSLPENLLTSPRVAPGVYGMGLLEAIPEEAILAKEDPSDKDGDGVSGRANRVWSIAHQEARLGRFGWKANQPSVAQQNFSAFLGDMGITSPLLTKQNCGENQKKCLEAYKLNQPEIDGKLLKQVEIYTKLLAVPAARETTDSRFLAGLEGFRRAQCQSCHVESYKTGNSDELPELHNQEIRPYTDLLLHDMGEPLADGRPDFEADGREWRTPPLWGIGLVPVVNKHSRYLHDGRARSLEEAILWHDGEARKSRDAFMILPIADREALLYFLKSL